MSARSGSDRLDGLETRLSSEGLFSTQRATRASYYALVLLTAANLLNYIDRSIISILAEAIKRDLNLDDAQLGFLLGTSFAIFFAVVGIAIGGIADRLSRPKLLAVALAIWSGMTVLGGMASTFALLCFARLGVGVGEAAANPCSHSLVSQIFPRRNRAMALSTYLSGSYVGGAVAMIIGGYMLQRWPSVCLSVPFAGACAIAPWKAALLGVGLPGLPLALLLLTISEPARPQMRGHGSTVRIVSNEFSAALPPFTLIAVYRVAGPRGVCINLGFATAVATFAAALLVVTRDYVQWISLGVGIYSIITWVQIQSYRDKPFFSLTFGDRSFLYVVFGSALLGSIIGTIGAWSAPYLMRTFALKPAEIGLSLGFVQTTGTVAGLLLGGWIVDRWKVRDVRAPAWMCIITLAVLTPGIGTMLLSGSVRTYLGAYFFVNVASSFWAGGIAALVQDLVLPRMRGSGASSYSLIVAIIMFGFGPYWVGKISTLTGSLGTGMLSILVLVPITLVVFILLLRELPRQTPEVRREIARRAGEPSEQVQP